MTATPTAPAWDPVRAGLDRALHALAGLAPDLAAHANRIGQILWSPPRIVIVGRLKAGKSTLVNALIGAPVAETAALEATSIVAVYQDGAPSRAQVVLLDGSRRPLHLSRGHTADLGVDPQQVAYLHRWLPSAAIRDFTLIDTPGLATLTAENEARTRRVLIDGFEQTRTASVDADAAVFLFDSAPRADEISFLKQLGFTPLNTLGVLSRCRRIRGRRTGAAQPARARDRPRPGPGGPARRHRHDGDADRRAARRNLPHRGPHRGRCPRAGVADRVRAARGARPPRHRYPHRGARGGARSAPRSGRRIRNRPWPRRRRPRGRHPERVVDRALGDPTAAGSALAASGRFAAVHRASRIIRELDQLAFTHPARDQIRGVVDHLRRDPALHTVVLFEHLKSMLEADPRSPVTTELRRLLEHHTPAGQLGLPDNAGPDQVRATAQQKLSWAHTQALSTMTAAEDAALIVLAHTYGTLAAT